MNIKNFKNIITNLPKTERMPVLFFGHGSPTNALEDNEFTRSWIEKGKNLPIPKAVLCISAHWFMDGTFVHGKKHPQTIHDYYGFPPELYNLKYYCPGAPEVAKDLQNIITKTEVRWDEDWGLDHGCWVVMKHLFPKANIPVFQMSLDITKSSQFHYELAQELSILREHGVMIIGSGNIVHNLGMISFDDTAKPYDWAIEFDTIAKKLILDGDHQKLINYKKIGHIANLAIPTPDHYWPLLYTLALQQKDERVQFFAEGLVYKSISMRSLLIQK